MSSRPNLPPSTVYNPSLFSFENDYLTLADADLRYNRIGGDISANSISCNQLYVGGALADLSAITGVTPGTCLSSKALIVDANRDIANIRYLTATQLTGTVQTASQTNITAVGNLLSVALTPTTKTISSVSTVGVLWNATSNRTINFNESSDSVWNLSWSGGGLMSHKLTFANTGNIMTSNMKVDCTQALKTTYLQIGTSTDTSRQISALTGSDSQICFGALDSNMNQTELKFNLVGDGSLSNNLSIGFYGTSYANILNIDGNRLVKITGSLETTASSTFNAVAINGSLSSTQGWINTSGTVQVTGGAIPNVGNGIGLRFVAIASTGYLSAHNHVLDTPNHINIGDGTVYCKSDKKVGINNTTPAYNLDISGDCNVSSGVYRMGTTTVIDGSRNGSFANISGTLTTANQSAITTTAHNSALNLCGFEDKTASTMSYDSSTRVFSISGTYNIWVNSVRYTKTTLLTTTAHASTAGATYWIYFNSSGVLTIATSAPDMLASAMCAVVYYYSNTKYLFMEERHGTVMDPATHYELHKNVGTFYVSGLALSGYTIAGTMDANNSFASSAGIISDEDLQSTIDAVADGGPYTCMYMLASNAVWTWDVVSMVPFIRGATYISYNQFTGGAWQLTEGQNNKFYTSYVVYVPSKGASTQMVVITGQTEYSTLSSATAETFSQLTTSSLLLPEILVRYKIVYSSGSAYTTTGKCRIESVSTILGSSVTIAGGSVSNHQALSGLELAGTLSTYGHIDDQAQTIYGAKTFNSNPICTLATASQTNITAVGNLLSVALTPTTKTISSVSTVGVLWNATSNRTINFNESSDSVWNLSWSGGGLMSHKLTFANTGNLMTSNMKVDCTQALKTTYLQVGSSTDTTRAIAVSTGGDAVLTLGSANSDLNQLEIAFKYAGLGSTSNTARFGFYGVANANILTIKGTRKVGINQIDPQFDMDVNGDLNFEGYLRENGIALLSSAINTTAGAFTAGRALVLDANTCLFSSTGAVADDGSVSGSYFKLGQDIGVYSALYVDSSYNPTFYCQNGNSCLTAIRSSIYSPSGILQRWRHTNASNTRDMTMGYSSSNGLSGFKWHLYSSHTDAPFYLSTNANKDTPSLYCGANNGGVVINGTTVASGYALTCNGSGTFNGDVQASGGISCTGDITCVGAYKSKIDTTADIKVDGSGQIKSYSPNGIDIFNSTYNSTRLRLSCTDYNAHISTANSSAIHIKTNDTDRIYIGTTDVGGGNICLHGTNVDYPLTINKGNASYSGSYHYWNSTGADGSGTNATDISCYMTGRLLCTGEVDVISDSRAKADIKPIKQALANKFIDDVQPKQFRYKRETDTSYGYIAQDLLKSGFTRFVQCHKNNKMVETIDEDGFQSTGGIEYSINTAYVIPLLHLKVKELCETIDKLERRISGLEDMKHKL